MSVQASSSERLARLQFDCLLMPASLSAPWQAHGADRAKLAADVPADRADELDAVAVLSCN